MSDKLDVTIGISADASGVEAGVGKATKSLRSLGGSAKKVAQDVGSMGDGSDKAAKKVARDTKSMERSLQSLLAKLEGGSRESRGYWEKMAEFKGVDKNALSPLLNQLDSYQAKQKQAVEATKSFSDSINGLQKAFVSAGAAAAAAKFISVADSVTVLNNQLKLATGSTESAALAYESLFQIAQRSRVGFTELGETFASITRAAAPLGLSQERLLRVTESIGNAMTISGGSAQGLQAALVQLSQGLSAGALRGDELNSVMEQAPRLAKALADGLGVTTGQLRAMGAEGQITAEKVIGALESQAGVLRGEVAGAALTVGQAFVQLGNSATHAIGSLDKATGASASAASAISAIASAINGLGQAAANNEAAIKAVLSFGAVIAGAKLATVAVGGVTTAFAAARIAVLGFSAALAASPIGFALVAVAALGASAYSAAVAMDAAGESAKGLEGAAAAAAEASAKEFKALQTAAEKAGSELSKAEKKLADLESRGAKGSSNLMLREAYNHTQRLVNKLREAKRVQDDLLRGSLGGAYTEGMGNNSEIVRRREAEAALAKEIKDYLTADARQTRAQIREEEISKARLKNAALIAKAEGDTNTVLQLQAALKTEIANIESRYKDSAAPRIKGDASAYATLSKRVNEYISQLALEAKQGDKVTAAQKLQIQLDDLLINSKGKLTAANIADLQARIEIASAMEREAKAVKRNVEAYQEYIKDQEAIARADVELSKAKEALWKNIAEQNIELENQSRMLELEASNIGKSAYERTLANEVLKAQIELEKELRDISNNTEYDAAAKNEAEAAARARAVKKIALAERKAYVTEWDKTSQTIGDTLADYIMGGGKDAATYLKRLFSTLVLQPVVQYGAQALLGGKAFGAAGGSQMPGGSLTDWSKLGGGAADFLFDQGVGMSLKGYESLGSSMQSLGVTIGRVDSFLKDIPGMSGGIGSAAGYLGSIYALSQGQYGSGIGSAIGTAIMPGIGTMIGGALGGLVDSLFGDDDIPRYAATAEYRGGVTSKGWTPGGQWNDALYPTVQALATGIGKALDTTAETFGKTAGYSLFASFSKDAEDKGVFGALNITGPDGKSLVDWSQYDKDWGGRHFSDGDAGTQEFMAAITADVKTAFTAMDLPGWSIQLINAAEDINGINAALQQIGTVKAVFEALGKTMGMFAGISDELQTQLLNAFGSVDALSSGVGAFYESFYSEQERMATLSANLRDSLGGLDISIDPAMGNAAKDQFRAAVEAAMAAGQGELAAQLFAMGQSFATAADYAQQAADALGKTMADLLSERRNLSAEYLRASGDAESYAEALRAIATEGYTDAERAAWDYNEALRSQISALDEAAQLQQSLAEITGQTAQSVQGVLQDLLSRVQATSAFRASLGSSIERARLGTMDLSGQAGYLRAKESGLWSQLGSAADPVAVAEQLQQTILDRISVESQLREQLDSQTLGALQQQLSVAQSLQSAAQSMQSTVDGLRLGNTSALNPYAQLQYAGSKFDDAYARALAGDLNAWKDVQSFGQSYVGLGRDVFASSGDSADIFFKVTEAMDQLVALGLDADPQITALNTQIELLQTVGQNTEQQTWVSEQQLQAFEQLDSVLQRQQLQQQQQADKQLALAQQQIDELRKHNELLQAQINQQAQISAEQKQRDAKLISAAEKSADAARMAEAQA